MRLLALIAALVVVARPAATHAWIADRPDHVLLARIECNIPGAQLWSVPTNGEAVSLGMLPTVATIEFRWGSGWFGKSWKRLQVSTPGDLCSAAYDRKTKTWTVDLACEVRAPGCDPVRVERTLATFAKPGDLNWEDIDGIPGRVTVPVVATPRPAARAPDARTVPTVMLAGDQPGGSGQFGTLRLGANVPDAEVIVDGAPAGRTPVRLILRGGQHDVTVQKAGYRARQQQVTVTPDSDVSLQVSLDPASP